MASDWDNIIKRFRENTYALKPWLKITLYGSYYPPEEELLLICIKNALINDGYKQTALVNEHCKDTDDPLEISKIFLQNSDVNFLIFTRNGMKQGVITELSIIAESDEMSQKILQCVVFDETEDENSISVPPLSLRQIKNNRIPHIHFRNNNELKEFIIDEAFLQLRRQNRILKNRGCE